MSTLPLQPPPDEEWPEYSGAYDIALNAERHAEEQLTINPSGREEKYNLVFARVTGILLLELFDKRAILSVEPCASLALEITSPPLAGTTNDLVFRLGRRFYNHFICMCAFSFSPCRSEFHFSRRSDSSHTPLGSLLR